MAKNNSLVQGFFFQVVGFCFLSLLSTQIAAQSSSINGKVIDARSGTGIIGAAVVLVGQDKGTATDYDGAFTFDNLTTGDYVLEVSYLGYTTYSEAIAVGNGTTNIDISLSEDIIGLDQVIVTGTSAATARKNLGNAISTVDGESISNSRATDLTGALAGKVTGALVSQNSGNPAGGISVTLRGTSTVLGSSDPLYIIDGVIMDNSSPEILDLGGYAQNRLVDINPADIESIEIIKGASAAAIYGSRASNGVVQIFTKKGNSGKARVSFSTSFKVNSLRKRIEENMEPMAFESPGDGSNGTLIPANRTNMQDLIFSNGTGSDNHLSMSGGSGNTKYYLSGSFLTNEGIVTNSRFDRYTTRLNLDQVLTDWLSASIGLGYSNSVSKEIPNGGISEFYGALTGFNFNNNTYDPNPDSDGNYISPAGFVPNPLEVINRFDFGQNTKRFNGNLQLKATIATGLTAELIFGIDQFNQEANGFIPVGSTVKVTGWSRSAVLNSQLMNADLNLRYQTDLSSNISSSTVLGFTVQNDKTRFLSITADNLSPVVNSTSAGSVISRGDTRTERNIQGAFIQQTFGLSDKLYVNAAVRVDAASPFGVNERTQIYPKASVSYLISEEPFLKNNNFISSLKLRASYGEAGNLTALSAYERLSNYSPAPINGATGLVPSSRQGNPDLKPERQKEVEFGIDMGFADNRFGLEFSYYNVDVSDLLLLRSLAPSSGFQTRLENVGTLNNKGIELSLKGAPIYTKNLTWNSTITFAANQNVVDGIEGGQIALPKSFGVSVARNGEPLGVLDGFIYERDANGEIALNAEGLPARAIDENGVTIRQTIGDPNPEWIGSFINEVNAGNLTFRLQLDAVQGFDVFNFTDRVNSRSSFGGGVRDAQEVRGELPRGFNNAAYNIWERYIEDGSFIKVREISIAYSINPNKVFSNVTFTLSGRNIISFDNYSGWDPEVSTAGQTNGVRGFDFNEVPIPRTIEFGVKATFE